MLRLRIFVTHPVQYHVPLWRALAAHPGLDVRVYYFSDHSIRGGIDEGFGVPVKWDLDLVSGYEHEFLVRDADLGRPSSVRIAGVEDVLRRAQPDWIWLSGYTMAFERQLARNARRVGAKLIIRAEFSDLSHGPRSRFKSTARSAYLRWFYRRIDKFCYPGELGRRHLAAHSVAADRTFFSPYSVDDSLIRQAMAAVNRAEARKAFGIPDDRTVILFSGKLIARKAPMVLLEALERVQARIGDAVGLIALGDGPLREEFEAHARRLLGDRAILPGFVNQSQLGRYFLASDVLVMPSEHETWGLVVNEAMHFGLPVVVSDQVGCHPDLVLPGETGFVFRLNDIDQMAEQMLELAGDRALARRMGQAAQNRVGNYTVQASASGVFRALELA